MKMMNYTMDIIFEKELYFLLPFYIFTHEVLCEEKITYYCMRSIIEVSKLVLESIAKNYEKVRKGVDSVMGGKILEHESKTIFNEGHNVGYNEGFEEGLNMGKMEEKEAIAKRMNKAGMKEKDIAKYVDASIKLVRQWIGAPVYM